MAAAESSKRPRLTKPEPANPLSILADDILFLILDRLDPTTKKSLASASKPLRLLESRHRRSLTPLRSSLLPTALSRYPSLSTLNLTLLPSLTDGDLALISRSLASTLRSVDLSRSGGFTIKGLESLVLGCAKLVEMDLSNRSEFGDREAAVVGKARNLERLEMGRWRGVTDLGVGCVAVGCGKLRGLGLRGCVNVTDLGVGLVALKCPALRRLDVSYLPVMSPTIHSFMLHLIISITILPNYCYTRVDAAFKILNQTNWS